VPQRFRHHLPPRHPFGPQGIRRICPLHPYNYEDGAFELRESRSGFCDVGRDSSNDPAKQRKEVSIRSRKGGPRVQPVAPFPIILGGDHSSVSHRDAAVLPAIWATKRCIKSTFPIVMSEHPRENRAVDERRCTLPLSMPTHGPTRRAPDLVQLASAAASAPRR